MNEIPHDNLARMPNAPAAVFLAKKLTAKNLERTVEAIVAIIKEEEPEAPRMRSRLCSKTIGGHEACYKRHSRSGNKRAAESDRSQDRRARTGQTHRVSDLSFPCGQMFERVAGT